MSASWSCDGIAARMFGLRTWAGKKSDEAARSGSVEVWRPSPAWSPRRRYDGECGRLFRFVARQLSVFRMAPPTGSDMNSQCSAAGDDAFAGKHTAKPFGSAANAAARAVFRQFDNEGHDAGKCFHQLLVLAIR